MQTLSCPSFRCSPFLCSTFLLGTALLSKAPHAVAADATPTPTPTATATATPTSTPAATPTATPTPKASDAPFEVTLLAYKAVNDVTKRIAEQIKSPQQTRIVMTTKEEAERILSYRLVLTLLVAKIQELEENIDGLKIPEVPEVTEEKKNTAAKLASFTAAVTGLGELAEATQKLFALIGTDTEIKSYEVIADREALKASFADAFIFQGIRCYDSESFPVSATPINVTSTNATERSEVMALFERISQLKKEIKIKKAKLNVRLEELAEAQQRETTKGQNLTKQLEKQGLPEDKRDELKEEKKTNDEIQKDIKETDVSIKSALVTLNDAQTFLESLTTPSKKTNRTPIEDLARAEGINTLLKESLNSVYLMQLDFVAIAGGSKSDVDRLTKHNTTSMNSGVVVRYMMADTTGRIVKAGVMPYYHAYENMKKKPTGVLN
jgi:hypothetical protein